MLSGGIAYSGIFSIAAALTIAITAFMAFLGRNETLRKTVFDGVNEAMPGILKTADDPSGLIRPESLILDTALNPASIIAAGLLLWTALSVMNALKMSLRAMFGIVRLPETFIVLKARDLVAFLGLAIGVLVSSVLTSAAGALGDMVLEFLGVEGAIGQWFLRITSLAVAFLVDFVVIALLFRYTAGARPPRRDLILGASLGALGTSVVRFLGTSVIGSVSDNPVLAPFVAVATLLLWVNFVSRIVLIAAAFTANPPAPPKITVPEAIHAHSTPNYVTLSVPETTSWTFEPFTGVIVPDLTNDPEFSSRQKHDLPEWDTAEGRARLERIKEMELELDREKMRYRIDQEEDAS
nr:YihY/virulence factor BrkB family protein [Flaviflexus equikiangi]